MLNVTSPAGHIQKVVYDAFGRPKTTELHIDGETFASTVDYDSFGRTQSITYPQGGSPSPLVPHAPARR